MLTEILTGRVRNTRQSEGARRPDVAPRANAQPRRLHPRPATRIVQVAFAALPGDPRPRQHLLCRARCLCWQLRPARAEDTCNAQILNSPINTSTGSTIGT